MWTVGLDVHAKSSVLCVLDHHGKHLQTKQVRGGWDRLCEQLVGLAKPFQVCFEASCGYGALYDRLVRLAKRVVVAHPGHLRLIFRAKRKNDRVDARKLATLLFLDQVPPVYVPSVGVRGWRGLIEHRRRLVDRRTKAKNGLRALLRASGIEPPKAGHWLWTREGLAWLVALTMPTLADTVRRDSLLEDLGHYDRQIHSVTRLLDQMASQHSGVALLQTIPGIGPRTAEAVLAYIDDPQRFSRMRTIGSYFGLVPCQDQSAGSNHLGHITRSGPPTVRRLLVEAAWQSIRRSDDAREYFERIMRGDPDRKKIAVVATAHRLVRVMLAMLRSGQTCRWQKRAA